jgi:hypothetical protein
MLAEHSLKNEACDGAQLHPIWTALIPDRFDRRAIDVCGGSHSCLGHNACSGRVAGVFNIAGSHLTRDWRYDT